MAFEYTGGNIWVLDDGDGKRVATVEFDWKNVCIKVERPTQALAKDEVQALHDLLGDFLVRMEQ